MFFIRSDPISLKFLFKYSIWTTVFHTIGPAFCVVIYCPPIPYGLFDVHQTYGMGRGKITPQSKIFENEAKKLKLTPKLEHIKSFPKKRKEFASITIFDLARTFLAKNTKIAKL